MPFTCPVCRAVSHHPMDEVERYCGRCHQFFDEAGQPYPLQGDIALAPRIAEIRDSFWQNTRACPVCDSPQVEFVASVPDENHMVLVGWKCRACKHEWSWRI